MPPGEYCSALSIRFLTTNCQRLAISTSGWNRGRHPHSSRISRGRCARGIPWPRARFPHSNRRWQAAVRRIDRLLRLQQAFDQIIQAVKIEAHRHTIRCALPAASHAESAYRCSRSKVIGVSVRATSPRTRTADARWQVPPATCDTCKAHHKQQQGKGKDAFADEHAHPSSSNVIQARASRGRDVE